MGKKIIASLTAAVLLVGGAATAMANESSRVDTTSEGLYCGEYTTLNDTIRRSWSRLSQSQKDYYIKYPSLAFMYPHGIDTAAGEPKGYPACASGTESASYKPTASYPSWCPWLPKSTLEVLEELKPVDDVEAPEEVIPDTEEPEETGETETPPVVDQEEEVVSPPATETETPTSPVDEGGKETTEVVEQ